MNDLLLLLPEIIITIVAFAVITLDIAWKDERKSATILPWLAFAELSLHSAAIIYIWPAASTPYGSRPMPVMPCP